MIQLLYTPVHEKGPVAGARVFLVGGEGFEGP